MDGIKRQVEEAGDEGKRRRYRALKGEICGGGKSIATAVAMKERLETAAMEEGRRAHERAAAFMVVASIDAAFNALDCPEPPPPAEPPPWRREQSQPWSRRSAFRKGRR